MILSTFTDGTSFYFVVPSVNDCHGNVLVEIKKDENGFVFSHSCSENQVDASVTCEHHIYALIILKKYFETHPVEYIRHENKHIVLQPDWKHIKNISIRW